MNTNPGQMRKALKQVINTFYKLWFGVRRYLHKLFNKNIYTRILFTNVTAFVVGLFAVIVFSSSIVKQITYEQAKQDLLRKAKRVNFALLQQLDQDFIDSSDGQEDKKDQNQKELLRFLADTFDARIMVFNREGNIVGTSAEQEVVPGSKVDEKFTEILSRGGTVTIRRIDKETGQLNLLAVVPMGNNKDSIKNGILLEAEPSNLELALNQMRFYLIIGGMIILVIFIFASVYLATYISRPISRLAATVSDISRGNDFLGVVDQPLDEINDLADQFNKLTIRLQKAQAESCRMEEEKARLFGEISHELRTPLTSVQGFVEAIRDGIVRDKALMDRYLDTIYTQTLHMARLVDDLLVLSRLESGNITVEKLPVNLAVLAQGVVLSMEAAASSNNTSIEFHKKTENAVVIGDADRMEQIIRNLLKNAIRATENGVIKVGIAAAQSDVVLTIEDNGIGIAPEDLRHIWDRFYRVKSRRASQVQDNGSGLGLVIVKKLVQLQGGSIDVSSQLGEGTAFKIVFPAFKQK